MKQLFSAILLGVFATSSVAAPATQPADPRAEGREAVRAWVRSFAEIRRSPVTWEGEGSMHPALREWLRAHDASLSGTKPGPLFELPWGYCTHRPGANGKPAMLYLHVFEWHVGGKLVVYGLAGDVKRASLLRQPEKDLPLVKGERFVVVGGLPKEAPDPLDTVVVLEMEGEPKLAVVEVGPQQDGSIVLHAREAIVHGSTLRFEPEPHKNTVGYWTKPADWVEWRFKVAQPGRYKVQILQGCGKGSGGSEVDFAINGQTLAVTVQDTGHFQNFVARDIGAVSFEKAGIYTVTVKPRTKPGAAVMDLRQVTLVRE